MRKYLRRSYIVIGVIVLTMLTFLLCLTSLKSGNTVSAKISKTIVVLDAGHGGVDGGVTGRTTGVKESELNLLIVKKLEKYLIDAGFEVVLTRSTDAGLYGLATNNLKKKDMKKRKEIIEKSQPSLVVSIHLNEYSLPSRRGAQVFFNEENQYSKILAQSIQKEFNSLEEGSRELSALKGDYYIVNCTKYPSVIAECGFLSNEKEEHLLITSEYQGKIAYAIFRGIVSYLTQTTIN